MALSRDIVIRLLGDADSAVKAQKAAADAAGVSAAAYRRAEREQAKQATAAEAAAKRQQAAMEKVGRSAALMGGAILAGLGVSAKAAIDWESAWTGVTKTVSGTPKQLADVEKGLRNLAKTLPSSHEEIAAVAEAAGQLGIQTPNIVSFTKTMIDLGQSTNLSAEDAATALARFSNIMGTSQDKVSNLGASIAALGNAGASTESEIVDMAVRMASAGHQIGLTEGDVLGIANALSSVGIEAEAGGTAFSKVMLNMRAAVDQGGKSLDTFASTAGMTAEQFKNEFQHNAGGAITAFVKGLANMEAQGKSTQPIMAELGFNNVRVSNALRASAAAADMFTSSIKLGNTAFQQNTALIREASKRYDTTASKMAIARNNLHDAAITIGQEFLPAIAGVADKISGVAKWFAGLPGPVKAVIGALGGVAGVVGVAGGAFLLLAPRVASTVEALKTLRTTAPKAAGALSGLGKAAGVATAIVAVTEAANGLAESLGPKASSVEATTSALLDMGNSMDHVNKLLRVHGGDLFESDINNIADAASRLTNPGFGNRMADFVDGIGHLWKQGSPERQHLIDQLGQMGQSLAVMVQSGNADRAKESFNQIAAEWKRGGGSMQELLDLMPAYQKAIQGAGNGSKQAAQEAFDQAINTQTLANNLDVAYGSIENYAKALGMSDDESATFIKASQDMGASLADFADPLSTYQQMLQAKQQAEQESAQATADATKSSKDSWKDYVKDVHLSFADYLGQLEQQVKDQENWQTNMLRLAGRVSSGTLEELAKMGPQGASLVADMVNASDDQLARFDDVTAKRSKDATDAWGAELTMAQPVLKQVAAKAGQGVVDSLAAKLEAGTITVAQIAQKYGIDLAAGVNPLLSALGRPQITNIGGHHVLARLGSTVQEADGGVLDFYANGGMAERHTAQIAPAGAWRVWAEPETGGEAYIPLSPSKRDRSMAVWRETGRRLGASFYAFGGVNDVPRPPSTAPFGPPLSTAADAAMQAEYAAAVDWIKKNVASSLPGPGGSVERWRGVVLSVLAALGLPSSLANGVLGIIRNESGGNPNAINLWDSNAQAGHPSQGLMQTIPGTFYRWAGPYAKRGITDPFANVYAGTNYAYHTYGPSMLAGGGRHSGGRYIGYETGTSYVPATDIYKLHLGEAVLTKEQAAAYRTGLAAGAAVPVGGGGRSPQSAAVAVKFEGGRIIGTLDLGGGLEARIDARIDQALGDTANAIHYTGV